MESAYKNDAGYFSQQSVEEIFIHCERNSILHL